MVSYMAAKAADCKSATQSCRACAVQYYCCRRCRVSFSMALQSHACSETMWFSFSVVVSYWAYDTVLAHTLTQKGPNDHRCLALRRECQKLSQDVNCCAFLRALHDWQCPTVQELQEPDLDMKHTAGSQQPASRGAPASSLREPSLTRYADGESPHL